VNIKDTVAGRCFPILQFLNNDLDFSVRCIRRRIVILLDGIKKMALIFQQHSGVFSGKYLFFSNNFSQF
jgi:hypothetical protein